MATIEVTPRSMYYGSSVALLVTLNEDGSENIAPMSSTWSLRNRIVLGMGAASRTVANLRRLPELTINLPNASMWQQVERLSGLTGMPEVPEHKAGQFRFEQDKWHAAELNRTASTGVRPGRITECPIQMEAVVESTMLIDEAPEGFLVVAARVDAMHVHEHIALADGAGVDPDSWEPLIFSFRSYRSAEREVGRMSRGVRK